MLDLEQLRNDVVAPAMRIDAETISTCPDYMDTNETAYTILVSTWYYMWHDLHPALAEGFRQRVSAKGLVSTIDFYSQCTQVLLSEDGRNLRSETTAFLAQSLRYLGRFDHLNALRNLLQALRFGKRFCPDKADKIRDESYQGFYAIQKELETSVDTEAPLSLIEEELVDVMQHLVNWPRLCSRIAEYEFDEANTEIRFTSGSSFSTRRSTYSKVKEVWEDSPTMMPPIGVSMVFDQKVEQMFLEPFNVLTKGFKDGCCQPRLSDHTLTTEQLLRVLRAGETDDPERLQHNVVKLMDVPKNYRRRRMIAPENALRQARATKVGDFLADELPAFANRRDQTRNQRLAEYGAQTGNIATIDLSAASDRINRRHFRYLPELFRNLVRNLLPTHFVDSRAKTLREFVLHSLMTMGNGLTFPSLSLFMASIGVLALKLAAKYQGWYDELEKSGVLQGRVNTLLSVYGDDIEIDTRAVATLIDLLEILGFKVNAEKSYKDMLTQLWIGEGLRFRESCGKDYLSVINPVSDDKIEVKTSDVSSVYWPKRPLTERPYWDSYEEKYIDIISSLISMHNHLLDHNRAVWVKSITILRKWVYRLEPYMTESLEPTNPDLRGDRIFTDLITEDKGQQSLVAPEMTDTNLPLEVFVRDVVCTPIAVIDREQEKKLLGPKTDARRQVATDLYNRYRYWSMLRYGPTYVNELDRILGISQKPLSFGAFIDCQKIVWRQRRT